MKHKNYYLLFSLLLFNLNIFSQSTLSICILDSKGKSLAYPEIVIPGVVHKIGNTDGILILNKNSIEIGSTITARHLGFNENTHIVTQVDFESEKVQIQLTEKDFELNDLIVTKNDFHAEKQFRKKVKSTLLPLTEPYRFMVEFDFTPTGKKTVKGKANLSFAKTEVTVDSLNVILPDSIDQEFLIRALKRGAELNNFTAMIFCYSSYRKLYYSDYLGFANAYENWEYTIRPNHNGRWNLVKGDRLSHIVSLNNNGIISYIETQHTPTKTDGNTYLLQTRYNLFNRQLIAEHTELKLLPNSVNSNPGYTANLSYSNYQKIKKRR